MINFQYIKASSPASAVAAITKDNSSMFIAGGTNLVDLMKKGITNPQKLIDITPVSYTHLTLPTNREV